VCLLVVLAGGAHTSDHDCLAIASQRKLEQPGELAVTIWYMSLGLVIAKCIDAVAKCEKRLVDVRSYYIIIKSLQLALPSSSNCDVRNFIRKCFQLDIVPSAKRVPRFLVADARSLPARSIKESVAIVKSSDTLAVLSRWQMFICKTACDRDDVALASVGDIVLFSFPIKTKSMSSSI
jgi:hypothetical protein